MSADSLHAALARLEASGETDLHDAELLFAARGPELDRLLAVSTRLRDDGLERNGRAGVITYSKKVFIPVTQLCQDRCHYCVFVDTPGGLLARGIPTFMSPDDILAVARQGAAMGCKEALFTLGDRPENRWPAARTWLDDHGYESTLDYIGQMAKLVLEETGLLPHLNPGVMSWAELQRLRPFAPSMGMMLETTATRLWSEKGGVHFGSPDKDPELRMRVIDDAGRSRIPFTTGVLLGIGENDAERADALFAIRASHERFGHVQETIVQNFRAKPRTAMQNEADLALQEYVAAVAVARVVMGPDATIQAPPNLTDATELGLLVRAGVDDWGGVSPLTPDHVNPERPWPELETLSALTAAAGFELRERLTAHPAYLRDPETWVDSHLTPFVDSLIDPATGLANEGAPVVGRPWTPSRSRTEDARASLSPEIATLLAAAAAAPASLSDDAYATLLTLGGPELDVLTSLADDVRHRQGLGPLTYAVNRNLDSSLYALDGMDALTPARIADLVTEAVELGATEICIQGQIGPELPGEAYVDVIRRVRAAGPGVTIHAYRPTEVSDGARRLGITRDQFLRRLRDEGVTSVPGTGARVLDPRLRAVLSENTDPPVDEWIDSIVTAHGVGLASTATLVYGHLETPAQVVSHLRLLVNIQKRTGGFREFIAMPFVPADVAPAVAVVAGSGPTLAYSRAVHAVARLMLHGGIDHIQAAWTKLGMAGAEAVLRGGADDLGGVLLDGTIWPEAGAEAYRSLAIADVTRIAAAVGRPARQRTTDYGVVPGAAAAEHVSRARPELLVP